MMTGTETAHEAVASWQHPAQGDALHRLHRAAASTLDLAPMLARVTATLREITGATACIVSLPATESEAAVRVVAGEGEGEDAHKGSNAGDTDMMRAVHVPLAAGDAPPVGTLEFQFSPDSDDAFRALLLPTAEIIAVAVGNARLYGETAAALKRKEGELQTLQRVTASVTSTLDLTRVLEAIAEQASVLGAADMVSIYELSPDGEGLTLLAGYEAKANGDASVREEVQRAAVRRAMQATQDGAPAAAGGGEFDGEGSVFCIPLRTAHGIIGGICLHFHDGTGPTAEQVDLLRSFSHTAAIAIEQARLYDDVRRALTSTSSLLQEMHHRVRNNLQTVAALLSMHVRRAGDEPWASPLREAVNRIRSIAAVHDLLTREDIGVTTVNEVAKLVMDEASTTLVPPGAEYRFRVEGVAAVVSSREATVLAILINELVANAVLHGLEGQTHGTVRVEIAAAGGAVTVRVEDDGAGFPSGFDMTRDGGLGLQIAQNLVSSDLNGEVRLERSPLGGGAVVITFTPRLVAVEPFGAV